MVHLFACLGAGVEIRPVELVGNVPAEGPELPALLHHGVKEGYGVEHGRPRRVGRVVQRVLNRGLHSFVYGSP